ncbi:MAG: hypothetical protein M1831_001179 [Alyxoria varia]|nr:MAG: hypothetical protein M1831_001179 [Alyxoria varia]
MASKIIVIGGVEGHIRSVFTKLSTLHSKNNFALAIIAGDLFSDPAGATGEEAQDTQDSSATQNDLDDLLNGHIDIPLPTYFSLCRHPLPPRIIEKLNHSESGELAPNLFFLGKRTTIKTSEGIKLVALGGQLDTNLAVGTSKDTSTPFCSASDADALQSAKSADILVTSALWPEGIRRRSKVEVPGNAVPASQYQQCVAELAATLKPRYHFSTSPQLFYEREPFFHSPSEETKDGEDEKGYRVTRFISLASFDNPQKQKWIYAFSLDPSASNPITVPDGVTASPLSSSATTVNNSNRNGLPSQNQSFSRFSQDTPNHHDTGHPRKRRKHDHKDRRPPPGPSECFFCLSNPNLATHLVVSIGTDAYLTTSKGPLTTPSTPISATSPSQDQPALLPFPAPILIIPLPHSATLSSIPESAQRTSTLTEMRRYVPALNAMLEEKLKGVWGTVTLEVSRKAAVHAHWQWMPMPAAQIASGLVEAGFKVEAETDGLGTFQEIESGSSQFGPGIKTDASMTEAEEEEATTSLPEGDALTIAFWSPATPAFSHSADNTKQQQPHTSKTLRLPLDQHTRFDHAFGRRVLAKLLGLEKRTNWRDCAQNEQEETAEAEGFKRVFEGWDFTVEGGGG